MSVLLFLCVSNVKEEEWPGGRTAIGSNEEGREMKPSYQEVPHHDTDAGHGSSLLQVGLSIQAGGLYVTHTVGVGRVQEQQVRRDDLIADHPHKVSHSHVLPAFLHKLFGNPDVRHVRCRAVITEFLRKTQVCVALLLIFFFASIKYNIGTVLSIFM